MVVLKVQMPIAQMGVEILFQTYDSFLLLQNSDRRKLILWLAKTEYGKKDWNVQLEIAPENIEWKFKNVSGMKKGDNNIQKKCF